MDKKYIFLLESTANAFAEDLKKDSNVKDVSVSKDKDNFSVAFKIGDKFQSVASMHESENEYKDKQKEEEYASKHEMYESMNRMSEYFRSEMAYEMKYTHARLNELEEEIYRHKQGHIPPIKDAAKMQEMLNVLGLGQSYEVVKPTIRVQASRLGSEMFIE